VDFAVKELKHEAIYTQWLKYMENVAIPLFWKATVMYNVINVQVYALEKFPNTE
jgi:hypothetical protein